MATKDGKRRASFIAARVFFCIIFFQVPLFRYPSPWGVCTSPLQLLVTGLANAPPIPIHVSSSEFAVPVLPSPVAKACLYPGAIVNGLAKNMTVPRWGDLLDVRNITIDPEEPRGTQFMVKYVMASASYYCISGAITGTLSGHMNPIATPALMYGLYKGGQLQQEQADTDPATAVYVYPAMLIAFICQFLVVCWPNRKEMSSKWQ